MGNWCVARGCWLPTRVELVANGNWLLARVEFGASGKLIAPSESMAAVSTLFSWIGGIFLVLVRVLTKVEVGGPISSLLTRSLLSRSLSLLNKGANFIGGSSETGDFFLSVLRGPPEVCLNRKRNKNEAK